MACKTIQRVSVPSLKLFGPMNKEFGEFSIALYEKIGWWATFCPPSVGFSKIGAPVTLAFTGRSKLS